MVYEYEEICLRQEPAVLEDVPKTEPQKTMYVSSPKKLPLLLKQTLVSLILLAGLLSAKQWWPQGHAYAKRLLCSGTIGPRQAAAQELLRDLAAGIPIPDALSAFCQEVVYGQD